MRIIKLGLISVVFFALLITGISLFFPSHVRVSKAIDITAPKDSVLAQINNPANWKSWYPGADSLELLYVDGQLKGLKTGGKSGLQIKSQSDSAVTATGTGPNSTRMDTGWNLYDGHRPNTTTVQWYMDFKLRWYPWEKFSSIMFEKRYGPLMEQGLSRLQKLLEQ